MRYDEPLDLNNETSLKKIIGWIKPHSTVLEFGPASGKMTCYLKEQLQCKVYIVEIDAEFFDCAICYAEDGVLGNIEEGIWLQKFANIQFDYVVFADVLEHLYDPLSALQKSITLLKEDGSVLISVPNIAHSDILFNLYNNNFQYTEEGLLDKTHIHFFTYNSLDTFCQNAGLYAVEKDAIRISPFCTEQKSMFEEVSDELRVAVENRPYFNVYQFVYRLQKKEYALAHEGGLPVQLTDEDSPINSKFYFDLGDGFSETNALQLQPRKHNGKFVIDIQLPENTHNFRFDPLEGKPCLITQISIFVDEQHVQPSFYNGVIFEEGIYFCKKGAAFIVENLNSSGRFVRIEYMLRETAGNDLLYSNATYHFFGRANEYKAENNSMFNRIKVLHEEVQRRNEQIGQLEKNKNTLRNELKDQCEETQRIEKDLQHLKSDFQAMHAKADQLEKSYNTISQSHFWRITAPARKCLDAVKRVFQDSKDKLSAEEQGLDIIYSVDAINFVNGCLTVQGWIFSPGISLSKVQIVLSSARDIYPLDALYGIVREDVYNVHKYDTSKRSGFFLHASVENLESSNIYLRWFIGSEMKQLKIGEFKPNRTSRFKYLLSKINRNNLKKLAVYFRQGKFDLIFDAMHRPHIEADVEYGRKAINYRNFSSQYLIEALEPINSFELECVDIILPVYNGYEYFDALFRSITQTQIAYRLIVIDDCSPDLRVWTYLQDIASSDSRINLLRNETNQGFVKTVNRGLRESNGHVVLLNTDVELPARWLVRLIAPIMKYPTVASVTPFSNCATICSFPVFAQDNELFEDLNPNDIDQAFQTLHPQYIELPTGVGFCMAMSRAAIDKVGLLDADSFARGYGEENDWCQRAIKMGYKNVIAENLFVYHKHGGSFLSDEKKNLIERNSRILLTKHPNYNQDVAKFCEADPLYPVRQYLIMKLANTMSDVETWVAFDHALGGGATAYIEKKLQTAQRENKATIIVRFHVHKQFYTLSFAYHEYQVDFEFTAFSEVIDLLKKLKLQAIYINELVTYPELYNALDELCILKELCKSRLIFLVHDYFAICPMINLIDHARSYCAIPENIHTCEVCAKKNTNNHYPAYESIESWRLNWSRFLTRCDEIIVFSKDTKEKFEIVYGSLDTIKVVPHQISYIPPFKKRFKTTDIYTIGILGNINLHKGVEILKDLIQLAEAEEQIRIVLIGTADGLPDSERFHKTGAYRLEDLATLTLQYDIDIFFIPSIVPETFSYTTSEIMQLEMPIAVFNLGAPAERVKDYEKGIIISKMNAECALREIRIFLKKHSDILPSPRKKTIKILFIIECHSFASRYRVEHCIEELLFEGVSSDLITIDELGKVNSLDNYQAVVIYRCPYTNSLKNFIDIYRERGIPIYFDIDDYVFDYERIKNLAFLRSKEYCAFEAYCRHIEQSMQLCDAYITSTRTLRQAIEEHFPDKPVYINRNAASLEMVSLSLLAATEAGSHSNVILGYFSGSKTHDSDFEIIKPVLLDIFEKNDDVRLYLVGCVDAGDEFEKYSNRITRIDFMDWRKLPGVLTEIDINLMPLEDTFFHTCKSENKWMEAALIGVPTVASWNSEFALCIQDGVDGVLCRNIDEWNQSLNALIQDPVRRKQIGQTAFERVLHHNTVTQNRAVAEIFKLDDI